MIDYKTFEEKFIFYFKEYNIGFSEEIKKDFYILTDYLLSENEKYNLTSIKDIDGVIVRHYIDSVMLLKYFDIPGNSKIIDIGTGAGFPALPLAIMRRDLKIAFLDSSNKKINFIKNLTANIFETASKNRRSEPDAESQAADYGEIAGQARNDAGVFNCLENTGRFDFYCGRAEDFGGDLKIRETYDFAVSRAVARLNVLCELAAPFIRPGGFFIAYKSKNTGEEISEAKNALKILGLDIADNIEFYLSDKAEESEHKRVLIKIKKFKETSSKYPRNFSKITKNPL